MRFVQNLKAKSQDMEIDLRPTHTGRGATTRRDFTKFAGKCAYRPYAGFFYGKQKLGETNMADAEDYEDELLLLLLLHRRLRRRRTVWIHPILRRRHAQQLGEFHRLVQELRLDEQRFFQYFRMTPETFENLLHIVGPHIRKQTTNYRNPISLQQRLAICFR
jgi:hypothetical protein